MKAFWTYTLTRFVVFGVCFAVVWALGALWFDNTTAVSLSVLLISLMLSSIISVFALAGMREKLAFEVQRRAERMTERIEESRRAEDID